MMVDTVLEVVEMAALKRGRVVRFNADKGYGFIVPEEGNEDEDIFFHVSTLSGVHPRDVRPGMTMEYDAVDSDGGYKAVLVRGVIDDADDHGSDGSAAPTGHRSTQIVQVAERGATRVSSTEVERAVTDILLESAPAVTGREIVAVRERLIDYARSMGWVQG